MRIIHGEHATYYSQRNNAVDPSTACGTTAAINALAALGYAFPDGGGQPEDQLIRFIRGDEACRDLARKENPQGKLPINQIQSVLALGISRWMGVKNLAWFNGKALAVEVFRHIQGGGVCLVTGLFPAEAGKVVDHTVALIGVETERTDGGGALIRWFIRDPWGDHITLYRDKVGRLVDLLPHEFGPILRPLYSAAKWCIFIAGKKA